MLECNSSTIDNPIFDHNILQLEQLLNKFFEIHNPNQANGQGMDIGSQYCSAVLCYNQQQKDTVIKSLKLLLNPTQVKTKILDVSTFWVAEGYHRDYFNKNGIEPHCNIKNT